MLALTPLKLVPVAFAPKVKVSRRPWFWFKFFWAYILSYFSSILMEYWFSSLCSLMISCQYMVRPPLPRYQGSDKWWVILKILLIITRWNLISFSAAFLYATTVFIIPSHKEEPERCKHFSWQKLQGQRDLEGGSGKKYWSRKSWIKFTGSVEVTLSTHGAYFSTRSWRASKFANCSAHSLSWCRWSFNIFAYCLWELWIRCILSVDH